jgi:hypothetical protein
MDTTEGRAHFSLALALSLSLSWLTHRMAGHCFDLLLKLRLQAFDIGPSNSCRGIPRVVSVHPTRLTRAHTLRNQSPLPLVQIEKEKYLYKSTSDIPLPHSAVSKYPRFRFRVTSTTSFECVARAGVVD